jgi:hypothetical protein
MGQVRPVAEVTVVTRTLKKGSTAMTKPILSAAVVLAGALAMVGTASADDFDAMQVCRPNAQNANVTISDTGIQNMDSSNAVVVYCPLKVVTCSSSSCTFNAHATGVDNNNVNAADSNVTCSLNFKLKQAAGTHFPGSDSTIGTVASMTTLSLSVPVVGPQTGLLYVKCTIGKGGSSYLTWLDL